MCSAGRSPRTSPSDTEDVDEEQVVRASQSANLADVVDRMALGYESMVGDGGIEAVGGRSAAPVDRSGAVSGSTRPSPRRGDERIGRRSQSWRSSKPPTAVGGAHDHLHHASAAQRPWGRPDHGHRRGRLVEQGTHDELIGAGGLYGYLYRLQYSGRSRVVSDRCRFRRDLVDLLPFTPDEA